MVDDPTANVILHGEIIWSYVVAVAFRYVHEVCHKLLLTEVYFNQDVACVLLLDELYDVMFVVKIVV